MNYLQGKDAQNNLPPKWTIGGVHCIFFPSLKKFVLYNKNSPHVIILKKK